MRILILVDCYLPSTKSSAKLIHDLATEFNRIGHEVVVVAPDDSLCSESEVSIEKGVTILRVRTGRIKGASKIVRGFNETLLSYVLWKKGRDFFRSNPRDLIVYYSPSIFFGSLVCRLKRLYGCPAYLVLRDIFPKWALDAGILRKGPIYYFFRYKEIRQYNAADIIGVQSSANIDYFSNNHLDGRYRLEVLFNWTSLSEEHIPTSNFRNKLGLTGKVVFFYGGNIGVAQDMDNILRLAKRMKHLAGVHFLLVGDGGEVPRLVKQVHSENLANVTIHRSVGQKEYLAMLSEFDVGLISLNRNLKTQNIPGKLLGYMYHSMPILASINPGNDLKDILVSSGAGFVSLNGEDDLLYKYSMRLALDPELRRKMGTKAHCLLERQFSVSKAAEQILNHFKKIRLHASSNC